MTIVSILCLSSFLKTHNTLQQRIGTGICRCGAPHKLPGREHSFLDTVKKSFAGVKGMLFSVPSTLRPCLGSLFWIAQSKRNLESKVTFFRQSFGKMSRFLTKKPVHEKLREGSCLNVVHVVVVTAANDWTALETHHEGTRSSSKASTSHPKVTTVKPSPEILFWGYLYNSLFSLFGVFPGCKAGNELAELVVRPLLQMKAAAAVRWLSANTRSLKKQAVAKVRVVDFLLVFLDFGKESMGRRQRGGGTRKSSLTNKVLNTANLNNFLGFFYSNFKCYWNWCIIINYSI